MLLAKKQAGIHGANLIFITKFERGPYNIACHILEAKLYKHSSKNEVVYTITYFPDAKKYNPNIYKWKIKREILRRTWFPNTRQTRLNFGYAQHKKDQFPNSYAFLDDFYNELRFGRYFELETMCYPDKNFGIGMVYYMVNNYGIYDPVYYYYDNGVVREGEIEHNLKIHFVGFQIAYPTDLNVQSFPLKTMWLWANTLYETLGSMTYRTV